MRKTVFQRISAFFLAVLLMFGVTVNVSADDSDGAVDFDSISKLLDADSYSAYKQTISNIINENLSDVVINYQMSDAKTVYDTFSKEEWSSWEGMTEELAKESVYLSSKDLGNTTVTWQFNLTSEQAGRYYIKIEYYSCNTSESSISSIERKLYIDNEIPFSEASYITLTKYWTFNYSQNEEENTHASEKPVNTTVRYETKKGDDAGYYKLVEKTYADGYVYTEKYKISQDINGNSMAPEMVQVPLWQDYYCSDSTGYTNENFQFYFTGTSHTITLEAQKEPVVIRNITLVPAPRTMEETPLKSYDDLLKEYADAGYTQASGNSVYEIQAEFPNFVSDSSIYASSDNSSSANYPIDASAQLYNVIGKNSYGTSGQWAAYTFTVNETGLHKIAMRYKQSALEGMYICRTIKLSGGHYGDIPVVPFAEAYNTRFDYNKSWQSKYIGDGINEFQFYFEAGVEYTIYVEVGLGSLASLISEVNDSLNLINECYLKILQYTGNDPDKYRNYRFEAVMPEVLYHFQNEAIHLTDISARFEQLCGTKGSHIVTLDNVARLINEMGAENGLKIAEDLSNLKSYLGTLGTWVNNSKTSSMVLDSINIVGSQATEDALPRANDNFFVSAWFEIKSFVYSFLTDYDEMGLTQIPDENTPSIEVWLALGRDQSQIWRSLIDSQGSYTDSTGIAVNLKLVTAGTLLPSILADKGPDVYMGLASADVINYAIRDAIIGISGNDKNNTEAENAVFTTPNEYVASVTGTANGVFSEVVNDQTFTAAAMNTITIPSKSVDGNSYVNVTYGIPMTMTFNMMFYRSDVLARIGASIPNTWDDVLALLPVLQANNMEVGLDYASSINVMIYQMGGSMWKYTDDPAYAGSRIGLDENVALEAFEYVCRLYTDYSFPVTYDAANRFRTGEMPLVIGGYTATYNQLTVYATEIEGLWGFSRIPGYDRDGDGVPENRDTIGDVTATVMLHGCSDYNAAWEFMVWQTSSEIQSTYGNRMVALIGPSAKYETANINAISGLSWTASEYAAIMGQVEHLSSITNYPGSYIIARYVKFAFLAAYNDSEDPIDAISNYISAINSEISRKRQEFGLNTLENDSDYPGLQG